MKTAAKWALIFIVAFCVGLPIGAALAQEPHLTFPNGSVTLHAEPCTAPKVVALLKEEYVPEFRSATVMWQGEKLTACWSFVPEAPGEIFIIDETGDSGGIPLSAFKPTGLGV